MYKLRKYCNFNAILNAILNLKIKLILFDSYVSALSQHVNYPVMYVKVLCTGRAFGLERVCIQMGFSCMYILCLVIVCVTRPFFSLELGLYRHILNAGIELGLAFVVICIQFFFSSFVQNDCVLQADTCFVEKKTKNKKRLINK